jgi:chitinase
MRRRTALVTAAVATVAALMAAGVTISQAADQGTATPRATLAVAGGAPYIYGNVSGAKDPVAVMASTGVKAFTIAFILNAGDCSPVWDSTGSLTDAAKTARIDAIRAAGGDVVVSFGGAAGDKLGNACADEIALAAAYQQVIDAFQLKAIDIDMEAGEVGQSLKILKALKIIKQDNPGVSTIMTIASGQSGLVGEGAGIPAQAASIGSPVDNWTIMPFDFGAGDASLDHGAATITASEGLHQQLMTALGGTDAEIYAIQGISSMNAVTDTGGNVTVENFTTMLEYAELHGLTRFTYWELSRDTDTLDYTKVIGQFTG